MGELESVPIPRSQIGMATPLQEQVPSSAIRTNTCIVDKTFLSYINYRGVTITICSIMKVLIINKRTARVV